jgi:predicted Zn-dependent protease
VKASPLFYGLGAVSVLGLGILLYLILFAPHRETLDSAAKEVAKQVGPQRGSDKKSFDGKTPARALDALSAPSSAKAQDAALQPNTASASAEPADWAELKKLYDEGDDERLEAILRQRITESPEVHRYHALLIDMYLDQDQLDKALVELEALNVKDPSNPSLRELTADLNLQMGDPERAETHLNAALSVNPHSANAMLGKLAVTSAQGEVNRGIKEIERHYEQYPDSAETALVFTELQMAQQNLPLAKEANSRALKQEPTRSELHQQAAKIAILEGRTADAVDSMAKAHDLAPDEPLVASALADLLYQSGEKQRAISVLEDFSRRQPEDPFTQMHLEALKENN